jgi:hypothetical protein
MSVGDVSAKFERNRFPPVTLTNSVTLCPPEKSRQFVMIVNPAVIVAKDVDVPVDKSSSNCELVTIRKPPELENQFAVPDVLTQWHLSQYNPPLGVFTEVEVAFANISPVAHMGFKLPGSMVISVAQFENSLEVIRVSSPDPGPVAPVWNAMESGALEQDRRFVFVITSP